MDRQIAYPGQIPLDTDLLNTNKFAMVGLAKLAAAVLGTATVVNGLGCVPTTPASLQVQVNPGEMYSLAATDASAYSSLSADAHNILKQGISLDAVTLTCTPPATGGQSINYLIQAVYQDQDTGLVTLPYYNASNPSQAWSGPNNTGAQQATARKGIVTISAKAGIAATTGTQTTPAPDAGYTGLWVVTVANGQTTITAGNISQAQNSPILPTDLLHAMQGNSLLVANDVGVANAYVVNYPFPVTSLTDGMGLWFKAANVNTGVSTINVNGLGTKALNGAGLTSLQGGEVAGWCEMVWRADLNTFVLVSSTGGAAQVATATQSRHAVQLGQVNSLIAATPGRLLGVQRFTSSGTYTPTAGTTSVVVELVGGGGAGGNTSITGGGQTSVAGGGGAGGYARSRLTSGFSGVAMTVGAGGVASGVSAGGVTSFGSLLSATGGTAAANASAQIPPVLSIQGHGGVGSSGNLINSRGGDGAPGQAAQATSTASGSGGSSYFGGGGIGQPTGAGPGQTATSPGAGGGGAFAGPSVGAPQVGGDGAAGVIIVHEYA